MNLAVDYGNSRIKAGLFEQTNLIEALSFETDADLFNWLDQHAIDHVIVSSVTQKADGVIDRITCQGNKLTMSASMPLPFVNHYGTPHTLGVDRIAAACGAYDMMPNQNVLVIDLGTCINYEFVDVTGAYHGGAISPGVKMRFQSMHTFTAKLPLVKSQENAPLIGNSTETCMQSGVMNGVLGELEGIIDRYMEKYPSMGVILCGGDAFLFENKLKRPIFVAPNLVLSGLNRIMLHNVNF